MPIQFACPLCGKQTVVADQYAGQTGPCAACGGTITIPRGSPEPLAPGPLGPPSGSGASGSSVLFMMLALLGGGFLICCGGLAALFFVGRGSVQDRAYRNVASNNLRQIGLALHNYHDLYNTLPPAVVTDADGNPLYSGRVLLLPFMEQANLYNAFDKSKAWDSPENIWISQTAIAAFHDRSSTNPSQSRSDFVFVTGKGTLFDGNKAARFADVQDGLSNTIAVVETQAGPDSWAEPGDWNADTGDFPAAQNPGRGLLVLYADGSVQNLQPAYAAQNLRQLVEIRDGQVLPPQTP
jgi:hypothetical protein